MLFQIDNMSNIDIQVSANVDLAGKKQKQRNVFSYPCFQTEDIIKKKEFFLANKLITSWSIRVSVI